MSPQHLGQSTSLFQLLPWEGGVNTSLDPSMIKPNELTKAENVVFGYRGSRAKRDGINFGWDSNANTTANVIGELDFWYGSTSSKTHYLLSVCDDSTAYSYVPGVTGGAATALTFGTTVNEIARLNIIGNQDQSFIQGTGFAGGAVNAVAVDGTGNVYCGGSFTSYNGTAVKYLCRLTSTGTLDTTFVQGTGLTGTSVNALAIATDGTGKLYVGGTFSAYNGTTVGNIFRVGTTGTLDTTLVQGTGFNGQVNAIAPLTGGNVYIGGAFTSYNGTSAGRITYLSSVGAILIVFATGTGFNGTVNSIALTDAAGANPIYVGGSYTAFNGSGAGTVTNIARLTTLGANDAGFVQGTGFAGGAVNSVAIAQDGTTNVYIGGAFTSYAGTAIKFLGRFTSGGALDTTFIQGLGLNAAVAVVAPQTDGSNSIYVLGSFTQYNITKVGFVARLLTSGFLDISFLQGVGFNAATTSIAFGSTSAVYIGGSFSSYNVTAWANSIAHVSFATLNNTAIIAVDGVNNPMKMWQGAGNSIVDLPNAPAASICRVHLGRVWTNDKTNPDRLNYSSTGNPQQWLGIGDSGALDIGIGDGDPAGITAIFPTFQGVLFVAKQTKLYRIDNGTPSTFTVTLVSSSIGCVSHNSVCLEDNDDIYFISDRGVHSLATTLNYGDFEASFVSLDIQKTFNNNWTRSRLAYSWAAYLPAINSIAFAVTDTNYSGTTLNNVIWLYNTIQKAWYCWPNVDPQSLITVRDTDKLRFYIGGSNKRVAMTFNNTYYDLSSSGSQQQAITMNLQTGLIPVDKEFYTVKGFKRFILFYRPQGQHTVTVTLTIDNYTPQVLTYSQTSGLAQLGVNFVLGTSVLGAQYTMSPYTKTFDGYGRGIQVGITESGTNEYVEIQGIGIEYEPAGTVQETILSG